MYRDFVRAIRDRQRAGDEPRAGDGRPAADGPDLRQRRARAAGSRPVRSSHCGCGTNATTSSSSAPAPAAGRWRTRWRDTGARILVARARRLRAAGGGELEPGGGLEAPALPRRASAGSTGSGREFRPYTHYCVGGNTKFWGSVLYRLRREDFQAIEHVDGVSPAWPIDYDTLEPYYDRAERLYHVHGQHGVDPTEPPRRPYPVRAGPARARHGGRSSSGCGGRGCTRRRCRSACCARRAGRLRALQHLQLVPVQGAREERRRRLLRPAGACSSRTSRCGPTRCARRLLTDASGRKVEAVEVERNGETVRVEAPLVVVSCGAVNSAALLLRSANAAHPNGLANSSGLVGRRYMAHLATMMQGFHPFRRNDTVFQKTVAINDYYLRGPDGDYPLGQIQSQGRTHGVMAQTVVPWIPLWAYDAWVARGVDWLAMSEDLPSDDNRVTVEPDGRIRAALPAEQPDARTSSWSSEMKRILRRLGFWVVVTHSHRRPEHDASVRHAVLRHRSAHVGARSVLPRARRRESVRRRRVVLPVVGGGQPGADDRGAGAAGGRPHQRTHLGAVHRRCECRSRAETAADGDRE